MRYDDLLVIMVQGEPNKIIMCRKEAVSEKKAFELVKAAFPKQVSWLGTFKGEYEIFSASTAYEHFSSQFDGLMEKLKQTHDWQAEPFVVLEISEKDGRARVNYQPLVI